MNPCPCGFLGDVQHKCTCSLPQVQRCRARVSGPLLDRIDIQIEVPAMRYKELADRAAGEASEAIRTRLDAARRIQLERFGAGTRDEHPHPNAHAHPRQTIFCNPQMSPRDLRKHCRLEDEAERLVEMAMNRLALSVHADSESGADDCGSGGVDGIGSAHASEAIQYRSLDREL